MCSLVDVAANEDKRKQVPAVAESRVGCDDEVTAMSIVMVLNAGVSRRLICRSEKPANVDVTATLYLQ